MLAGLEKKPIWRKSVAIFISGKFSGRRWMPTSIMLDGV